MIKMSVEEIRNGLREQNYIASDKIVYAVYTALALEKPLLLDGNAGVGKTELSLCIAKMLDIEHLRLQCYEGIDASKVLYDINYPKQLLYQNILKERLSELIKDKDFEGAVNAIDKETDFYGEDFILERPLLKALRPINSKRYGLCLDEIDKSDVEAEALLLEVLSTYEMSIPEYGTIKCPENLKPVVVLTSNNQRELSEALRRRCVYLYIDYPTIELETEIIASKARVDKNFAKKIASAVNKIRDGKLKQKPSIAEAIEWATALFHHLDIVTLDDLINPDAAHILEGSLQVLLKNSADINTAKGILTGK